MADEMDAEFRALLGDAEDAAAPWLTTPPWAIRYRPLTPGDHVTGVRVVVAMRGRGIRSDLRAVTDPYPDEPGVWITHESHWYRNPTSPIGQAQLPPDKVWIEELVPFPVDLPPETDPSYVEALRQLRRTPALGSPWPLRLPTRAQDAGELVGRRVIVRQVNEDGTWWDRRDHRAVSPILPSPRMADDVIRVADEASWYWGWSDPTVAATVGRMPTCVWVE